MTRVPVGLGNKRLGRAARREIQELGQSVFILQMDGSEAVGIGGKILDPGPDLAQKHYRSVLAICRALICGAFFSPFLRMQSWISVFGEPDTLRLSVIRFEKT